MDKELVDMLSRIEKKVDYIQEELASNKEELGSVKVELGSVKEELGSVKEELKSVKSQQQEDHQILKNLEHNSNVNRAEHDNMANGIAYIKGELQALRKDLSTVEIVTANNYADIAKLKAVK